MVKQVKTKTTLKGHLHTYRLCDDVWTFYCEESIIQDGIERHCDCTSNQDYCVQERRCSRRDEEIDLYIT
jgi:hypothetical protein